MRALLKALFLGLLLLAAPSAARDAPGEGPDLLTVPFDPPLGQALAYTVVIVKNRSAGESRMELEQELTFERLGKGYLLRLAMLGATIDGTRIDLSDEAMREAIPAPVRSFLMSVAIELDAAGEPLRLRDWDEMRAMLRNLPGLAAERAGEEDRERAREIAALVFGPLLSLSAEEAP